MAEVTATSCCPFRHKVTNQENPGAFPKVVTTGLPVSQFNAFVSGMQEVKIMFGS